MCHFSSNYLAQFEDPQLHYHLRRNENYHVLVVHFPLQPLLKTLIKQQIFTSSSAAMCSVLWMVGHRTVRLADVEPKLLRLHTVTHPPPIVRHVPSDCFTFWLIFVPGEFCQKPDILKGQTSSVAVNAFYSLPYLVRSVVDLSIFFNF